ncbi:MFS transporter, partial [Photobacterium sanguinicancri]
MLGTVLTVVAIAWSVMATSVVGFAIAFGPLLSVGLTLTSPVALTPLISHWFSRQRGKALFFLSTGSMAGIAVMTPVLTLGIELVGWRATLVAFSVLFVVLVVPAALLVMREDPPEGADGTGPG